ncbi:extensin-like [Gossypium arboreum]|uniref:extensin-like n=1 Tax=Gossypium arboreum TaxID=29729 RepID=UPI0008196989|nr:extensin-like [Gossypium arboreum]
MVVPPHTTRIVQHLPDLNHAPEPEPQQEPEPELHSGGSSYHPDLGGDDYFSGSSGHGYHSEFDIFSPLPPQYSSHPCSYLSQYSTPSGPYPPMYSTPPEPYQPPYSTPPGLYSPPYSTPLGSSSSMAFETYDFSSMFHTPPHTNE